MPNYRLKIEIRGNTQDMASLRAAEEMMARQATEVLANIRLLSFFGQVPPKAKLFVSVNNTPDREIPMPEPTEEPEPKQENPFESMD